MIRFGYRQQLWGVVMVGCDLMKFLELKIIEFKEFKCSDLMKDLLIFDDV